MNRKQIGPCGLRSGAIAWRARAAWGVMLAAVVVVSSGCASYPAAKKHVSQVLQSGGRRGRVLASSPDVVLPPVSKSQRFGSDEANRVSAGNDGGDGVGAAMVGGVPWVLREYLAEALAENPSIASAIADVRAKLARIPQVTALADPILKMVVRPEPIQTAAGDVVFTMGIAQKIPLPAKLDRKGRMAHKDLLMSLARLDGVRLRVMSDVERAFYRVYVADRSIELTGANLALLEDLERVVDSQYRVNRAEQQDVLRVQTELSNLRNEESTYRRQRESAVAALNQLRDRDTSAPIARTAPARLIELVTRVGDLVTLAERRNPELEALKHQIERDREGVRLAELGYWPDLTLGVEWNKLNGREPFVPSINPQTLQQPRFNDSSAQGDDNWALIVGFNIPIWAQRVEAAKREARHKLERSRQARHAARNLIAFRIHDALTRAMTEQESARLSESTLIPQSRQTYEVSLSSYEGGRTEFLTVIENWRQMLFFELMFHRHVAGLEIAVSELQREVGMELVRERIDSPADNDEAGS